MTQYLGCTKFKTDVVDDMALLRAVRAGNKKYPNATYQIRLYQYSHAWGHSTGIQLCWYSREKI